MHGVAPWLYKGEDMISARICMAFSLLVVLAGCTGLAGPAEGPAYLESKAQTGKPGHAVLYVFRQYAEPTAFLTTIQIDEKEVAKLPQGGYTWVYATPGTHKINAVWAAASQRTGQAYLDIVADQTYYVGVLGSAKADFYAPSVIGGILSVATMKMSSGFELVPADIAEQKLTLCCKFQKPLHADY